MRAPDAAVTSTGVLGPASRGAPSSRPNVAVFGAISRPAASMVAPSGLHAPVEVHEGDEPPARRLGAAVAAGAETDVVLESQRRCRRPVPRHVLPAGVGGPRVDDEALHAVGVRRARERVERRREAAAAVVVHEHHGQLWSAVHGAVY